MAGYSKTTGDNDRHAALWNGTTATDLGTLGGSTSEAADINNAGQVVGYAKTTGDTAYHATLWNGTTVTDLGTLGGSRSFANGINDVGRVVGASYTQGDAVYHATLWNGNAVTDLGTLGGAYSEAADINNIGHIVGYAETVGGLSFHATLWNDNAITDLNSFLDAGTVKAGWILSRATAINDKGWIVGVASNTITRTDHAFLLSVSTIPEPESYTLLMAGLGLMSLTARRKEA